MPDRSESTEEVRGNESRASSPAGKVGLRGVAHRDTDAGKTHPSDAHKKGEVKKHGPDRD